MEYQHSWQVGPQEEGPDYVTPIILSCLGSKTEAVTKIGPGNIYIYIYLGGGFDHFLFSPRTLGKSSNLTHIFFKWVETTY